MNSYLIKSKSLFVSVLFLVFFELLSYFLLKDNIFNIYLSTRNLWYLVLVNAVLVTFSCFWVSFPNFLKEETFFKTIIIVFFDLSIFLFLFFSSFFLLNQIIVVVSADESAGITGCISKGAEIGVTSVSAGKGTAVSSASKINGEDKKIHPAISTDEMHFEKKRFKSFFILFF